MERRGAGVGWRSMRWLVFLGLVACGDNFEMVDEPAASHGGDRLEPYWFALEGTRELASVGLFPDDGLGPAIRLFDRMSGEDCELVEWDDGLLRCVPGIRRWDSWFGQHANFAVFADPSCRDPRGLAVGTPDYFLFGERSADKFITTGVLLGGAVADEQGEYYELRDGICIGPLFTDGNFLVTIVGSLEKSRLVAFSREQLSTTAPIGHRALVGDDGTLLHIGYYDRALDAPCTMVYGETDNRCIPSGAVAVGRTFADDACTRPAVADDARFADEYSEITGCHTIHELGEPREIQVFEHDGGACIPTTIGRFRIGTPIPSPSFDVSRGSTGRVVDVLVNQAPVGVFDTLLDTTCTTRDPFSDFGPDVRCIPPTLYAVEHAFADAACTQPIAVAMQPSRQCDRRGRFAVDQLDFTEVGEPASLLFTSIDNICVPLVAPDGHAYHAVGAPIQREAFAPAILVHAR